MTTSLDSSERQAGKPIRKIMIATAGGTAAFSGGIGIVSRLIEDGFDDRSRFHARVFDPRGGGSALRWPLFFMCAAVQLIWAAWRGQVDIVHLQVSERSSFIRKGLLMALARLLGLTTILHHHGAELISSYWNGGPLLRWIMRQTILNAHMNIVLGGTARHFLTDQVGADPERVHILRNASVDWAGTPELAQAGRKRLLLLANLSPRKGVSEFLQALALLRQRGHDIEATLAGGGDVEGYREQARQLGIDEFCRFTGWVERDEVGLLLSNALALVLPSHNEGLPIVILEALSAHVPVVATPVGSIPEVLTDGENYHMVPPRDAAALAEALEEIIGDPALRARLAEGGRKLYEHQFEAGAYLKRLAAIYSAAERSSGMLPESCPHRRTS